MQKLIQGACALLLVGTLAACDGSDLERGAGGAALGAVAAGATGNDPLTGAAIGGAAGAVCDDLAPAYCRNR